MPADPDLDRFIASWPTLPDHIKRAVLTLVDAAGVLGQENDRPTT